MKEQGSPLGLRGHHLLCLLGFRGLGYSPQFIRAMAEVAAGLAASPPPLVEALAGPDVLCRSCPHLGPAGCRKQGLASEARVEEHDRRALGRLKLDPGQRLSWGEVKERIGRLVPAQALGEICRDCEWLGLGYCREGVAALSPGGAAGKVEAK